MHVARELKQNGSQLTSHVHYSKILSFCLGGGRRKRWGGGGGGGGEGIRCTSKQDIMHFATGSADVKIKNNFKKHPWR